MKAQRSLFVDPAVAEAEAKAREWLRVHDADQAALRDAYNAGLPAHKEAHDRLFAEQVKANHAANDAGRKAAFSKSLEDAREAVAAYERQAVAIRATPTWRPENSYGFEKAEQMREAREREGRAKYAEKVAGMWRETMAEWIATVAAKSKSIKRKDRRC